MCMFYFEGIYKVFLSESRLFYSGFDAQCAREENVRNVAQLFSISDNIACGIFGAFGEFCLGFEGFFV